MRIFKEILMYILGFFVTIMLPPLIFSVVSYFVFPNTKYSFIQIFWLITMIWLAINYITISIEKNFKK